MFAKLFLVLVILVLLTDLCVGIMILVSEIKHLIAEHKLTKKVNEAAEKVLKKFNSH